MSKAAKILCAAAILILLISAALYFVFGSPLVLFHNNELKNWVTSLTASETTLNEAVPFEWDAVYTFAPYTSKEEIEKTIGFKSRSITESTSEGIMQLIFVKDNKITASVTNYPSTLGYNIIFENKVNFADNTPFTVTYQNGIVTLTQK